MPRKQATTLDDIITSLETLRSHLVDLEALAHSVAQAIEHIPYVPRRRPLHRSLIASRFPRIQRLLSSRITAAHPASPTLPPAPPFATSMFEAGNLFLLNRQSMSGITARS